MSGSKEAISFLLQMNFQDIIHSIHPISEDASKLLFENIEEVSFPKGHLLFRADKIEPNLYFIKKGIVRAYSDTEENEITFWFGKEGDLVISMRSYIENQKGYENIEVLEDTTLYELKALKLQDLFEHHIEIANWGRKLAEKELIKTEELFISRQFKSASERYSELLKQNPELIKRVQLGHIASYLGITQVSLSRIRAEIR